MDLNPEKKTQELNKMVTLLAAQNAAGMCISLGIVKERLRKGYRR